MAKVKTIDSRKTILSSAKFSGSHVKHVNKHKSNSPVYRGQGK
jgi:hypothetical protein